MKIVRGIEVPQQTVAHESAATPSILKQVLATKNDLVPGQVMMINWSTLLPNGGFQSHYHEDMQEVFVIMSGRVEMTISDTAYELATGDAAIIDPKEIHSMKNLEAAPASFLVFGISQETGGKTVIVSEENPK